MNEKTEKKILSDREVKIWIISCPVRVTRVRVEKDDSGKITVLADISSCTDIKAKDIDCSIEFKNINRETIGTTEPLTFNGERLKYTTSEYADAYYADIKLHGVVLENDVRWNNDGDKEGILLPKQRVIWQSDPLYQKIKAECAGKTEAKYYPDTIEGAWRCTCGCINLCGTEKCALCGCEKSWLDSHFDNDYLENLNLSEKENEKKRKKPQKRTGRFSDKVKGVIITVSALFAVALVCFTVFYMIPAVKYSSAEAFLEEGKFDEAIRAFKSLEDFRDSSERSAEAAYKKAQFITGIDDVYTVSSEDEPWYSITEEGVLSFRSSDYTGSWREFTVPDIVDGTIVRELDRNFFMNCEDLLEVNISDCVEKIGEQAFYNCKKLYRVNFGSNIIELGARAFINCISLESMEIPDTVEKIGIRLFNNCTLLKSVVLGEGTDEIPDYMFSCCTSLKRITVKTPVKAIGKYAFSDCDNFEKVFCRFSESDWIEPETEEYNEAFEAAEVIFE